MASQRTTGKPGTDEAVDRELVLTSLSRVLTSAQFHSSERIRQFLGFVVEETLAGRADGIKAYSIAVDCFQRDPDFDPQLDPYVRIVARRLRRALRHYYEDEGARDTVRISMPRGGYVPYFECSSAGGTLARPEPSAPGFTRPGAGVEVRSARLAVVRIERHDDESGADFIAGGLTHEIILGLSHYHDLRVVGPITIGRDEATATSPVEIGQSHDTDFVLMGSVHRYEGKLRVTVSLTEVDSSSTIWSERFEKDLTLEHLFAVHEEIAATVADRIAGACGIIVRRSARHTHRREPSRLSSYEAVLRGYHWNNVVTPGALEEARVALEHAVATDEGYALPRALLSDVYYCDWSSGNDAYANALERAADLAEEAVEIDRFCSDVHWALGQSCFGRRDVDGFRNAFDLCLELHPRNSLHMASYALFLTGLEEWDEAAELHGAALQLNPQLPTWHQLVPAMARVRQREWSEALAAVRCLHARGFLYGPALGAAILGHMGQAEEAAAWLDELLQVKPRFAAQGRELFSRLLYSDGNVAVVIDGLAKAGLEVA